MCHNNDVKSVKSHGHRRFSVGSLEGWHIWALFFTLVLVPGSQARPYGSLELF